MNKIKLAASIVCALGILGIVGCGPKAPDAVALDFLKTMQAGKASPEYLAANCTSEATQIFTMFGPMVMATLRGATWTVVDTKIDGDEATVKIKLEGGEKPGAKDINLVRVDGKWKVTKIQVSFEESAEGQASAGRRLFTAMTMADLSREMKGLYSVWPRTSEQLSDDKADIAGTEFMSATEYFRELLDMRNFGKENWRPYLESKDISAEFLSSVFDENTGMSKWIVLKGMESDDPEVIPCLVSSNVDTTSLLRGKGLYNKTEMIRLLKYTGEYAVIVYKSGAATIVRGYNRDFRSIYKTNFTLERDLSYLLP